MRTLFIAAMLLTSLIPGLSGCGERDQTVQYANGRYRGKPDTRPFDNAPPAATPDSWKKGDREGWQNQIHSRNAAQNEHRRIGH